MKWSRSSLAPLRSLGYNDRMSGKTRQVLTAAMTLPDDERAELEAQLIASLDAPPDDADWQQAWDRELTRRLADLDSGRSAVSWPQARREIAGAR